MINYQKKDYNPITHEKIKFRPVTTSFKTRGLEELIQKPTSYHKDLNPRYYDSYAKNSRVFHKKSGDFTRFDDECLKKIGGNPFKYPDKFKRK